MTHYNLLRIFHKCNPCQKAVCSGGCLGVPLRVGLSAASPRYAVVFPLQSLTWVKGFSLSCACTLTHGASAVRRNFPRPVLPERVPRRLSGSRHYSR